MITRRQFLKSSLALPFIAPLAPFSTAAASQSEVELTEITLPIVALAEEFHGYRIGFASDFHLGAWLEESVFEQALSHLAHSKLDLLLLGGDHIGIPESFPGRFIPYIAQERFLGLEPLREAPEAIYSTFAKAITRHSIPDGILSVYGNHDHWLAPEACNLHLSRAGVRTLVNEGVYITRGKSRIQIYGIDDYWTGIPRIQLPPEQPAGETRILLSHNPDVYSRLIANPGFKFDLALAGHTHGGQIRLPLVGSVWYNVTDRRLGEGLFVSGGRTVYTTRGIGVVEIPLRYNCPPEVTVFTLKSA